jgi:hypothetical protein
MTKLPTYIVSYDKGKNETHQPCELFTCDNGITYKINELCRIIGIGAGAFRNRFKKLKKLGYFNSSAMFHRGNLTDSVLRAYGIINTDADKNTWNRAKCRRDGSNCDKYNECLDIRLGLTDKEWIAPLSTDMCFVEKKRRFKI